MHYCGFELMMIIYKSSKLFIANPLQEAFTRLPRVYIYALMHYGNNFPTASATTYVVRAHAMHNSF